MERCIVAYSDKPSYEDAFSEVAEKLKANNNPPILILFFSSEKSFWYYNTCFKKFFPSSVTMGATTYTNISSDGFGSDGVSVMAIYSGIEISYGALFQIDTYPANYVNHIKKAVANLSSIENTCCFCLSTALFGKEVLVLDTFAKGFDGKNIPVVGSSCGMSNPSSPSYVSLNGEMYSNSSVFVLIHNLNGRLVLHRENIFKKTNFVFNTTDVDCDEFKVYEYDNMPAADAISEMINIPKNKLPEYLSTHPMGRIIKNEFFITEVNKVYDDGSISFFANIYNHSKVALLELDNIEAVWSNSKEMLSKKMPNPSFGLVVNCVARTKLFERMNIFGNYNNVLKTDCNKYIGVSGYGEQLNSDHMNQSLVLVLFE